ncbi:hypothetical protein KAT36_04600 [Candidatus Pacearchaeota archaeon]|nr:hypothetical protein [Candidatus Pacearchaeota archaeon]
MVKINISKRNLHLWVFGFVFLFAIGFVVAYNSGASPSVMGHDVDEIDWSKSITQLKANKICIGGDCKTSWPSGGVGGVGGSVWTVSGTKIYYNSGNVGIGITDPTIKLDVVSTSDNAWSLRGYNNNIGGSGIIAQIAGETGGESILAAYSGASYKFVVRGDGKVGIGTSSPKWPFQIKVPTSGQNYYYSFGAVTDDVGETASGFLISTTQSGDGGAIFAIDVNKKLWIEAGKNQPIVLQTGQGNGKVGIGTSNPAVKLHVVGAEDDAIGISNSALTKYAFLSGNGDVVGSGYVTGQKGLCIGEDCKTSWPGGDSGTHGQTNCYWTKIGTHGNYVCPSGYYVAGVCLTNSADGCSPSISGSQNEWVTAGGIYCCKF